jgi:Fic family protein
VAGTHDAEVGGAGPVIGIGGIERRQQRAGVQDQCHYAGERTTGSVAVSAAPRPVGRAPQPYPGGDVRADRDHLKVKALTFKYGSIIESLPGYRLMPGGRYVDASWTPDFRRSGRLGGAGRYRAFVPDGIAGFEPQLSAATSALSERSGAAVRDLNTSASGLRPLEGLARQLLRSEALASSAIEGLRLSHRKLAQAEVEGEAGNFKALEVIANTRAMEEAVRIGSGSGDFTVDEVLAIHRELAVVPPLDRIAGQLREEQGWIGGDSPPDAAYVPPPSEHVPELMGDLCHFMSRDDLSVVAQAAIAHAQFETVHPFGDGNGRVGRCLIHVLFRRRGIAPTYVPPVSLVLGANKDAYIAGLENFRADEVDRWVAQFARAVEAAAEHARGFSSQVADLQADWTNRAEPMRADATARAIIEHLPSYPYITAAIAEQLTGRSRVAAINGLEHLNQAGILNRHRNQRKGDSWEAKELFALLDRFEASVKA